MFIVLPLLLLWFMECISGEFLDNQNIPPNVKRLRKVEDNIGLLTHGMHISMTQRFAGQPLPNNGLCKPRLMNIVSFEVKLSDRPYGNCSYCCPIKDPKQHMKIYFTNKTNGVNTTEFNPEEKVGMLSAIGINNSLPTVIYIHGFSNIALDIFGRSIRDAYLKRSEDHNIILVDWSELCASVWYWQAVANLQTVAAQVASFIKFYDATGELPISNIHLLGFSLGGQMVGFIGKHLEGKIPRITALDPSFPLFSINDPSQRISKSDAQYVDAIHTDAGNLGTYFSVGHADFFPNGGYRPQPGCDFSTMAGRSIVSEEYLTCGHVRAVELYVESMMNPTAFPATKCGVVQRNGKYKKCNFTTHGYMGILAKKSKASGNLYLTTNDRIPYGKTSKEQENGINTINLIL